MWYVVIYRLAFKQTSPISNISVQWRYHQIYPHVSICVSRSHIYFHFYSRCKAFFRFVLQMAFATRVLTRREILCLLTGYVSSLNKHFRHVERTATVIFPRHAVKCWPNDTVKHHSCKDFKTRTHYVDTECSAHILTYCGVFWSQKCVMYRFHIYSISSLTFLSLTVYNIHEGRTESHGQQFFVK